MLVDLVLSRQSFWLLHGLYYFVFAMTYVIWTVIFHTSELDRPCACSEDDDEPAQMGCHEAGDDDGADECNYIYSSLNWAGETRGKTLTLAAVILLAVVPIVVIGFHAFVLVFRAYLAPVAPSESRQLQRQDSLLIFKSEGYCKALAYEFQWERLKPSIPEWVTSFRICRFSGKPTNLINFRFVLSLHLHYGCRGFRFSIYVDPRGPGHFYGCGNGLEHCIGTLCPLAHLPNSLDFDGRGTLSFDRCLHNSEGK
jgi:hypothetical protein